MKSQSDSTIALLNKLTGISSKDELNHLFAPGHVRICLGQNIAHLSQAQLVLSFAVNLLSRLSPVVQKLEIVLPAGLQSEVFFPRWHAHKFHDHIATLLSELNPPIRWTLEADIHVHPQCELIVGEVALDSDHHVYVGSDGWEVQVSPHSSVSSGALTNPVGAYAASCIAVGEVWKKLLLHHDGLLGGRPIISLNRPLKFSTLSYLTDPTDGVNPPLKSETDLKTLTIVGLGAGGGAAAFTLASLSKVRGKLNLIEPDEVTMSNLNRYVFASEVDAVPGHEKLKTDVVGSIFKHHAGLTINPLSKAFNEITRELSDEDYRYVLAAVHSRVARREIQYETPFALWDGGATEDGDFRIWRIAFGKTECMFCKHPLNDGDPEWNEAQQLSNALGLSPERWFEKIKNNSIFSGDEIESLLEKKKAQGLSFDLPRNGERYSDWFKNQCGRLQLAELDQEIPIPFAPVMAGVLLAGEVIKEHRYQGAVLPHYYGNTLIGNWMRRVLAQSRPQRADCAFCNDPTYRLQFEKRWGKPVG